MKSIKYLLQVTFFLTSFVFNTSINAQSRSDGGKSMKGMVDDKRFAFIASTANTARGSFINLTSQYDLQFRGDTLIASLPFFGRAYSAAIGSQPGGINFTSTSYKMDVKEKKKSLEITLRPDDVNDVRQLYLNVFKNGRASLQVVSNNREPMTFSGYIKD